MGKRIQRIKELFTKEKQPMTNSNKFDVYTKMEVQEQLDKRTLEQASKQLAITDLESLSLAINEIGKKIVHSKNLEPYFLLQYQANYFCGTCKFNCEDFLLRQNVLNVIRGAFMLGSAGLYFKDGQHQPVSISQVEYNVDGTLKSCKILPLSMVLQKMNEYKTDVKNMEFKGIITLNEQECKNLAIFNWGIMAYSAWITIWPFVNLQHQLLTMIIIASFVFNKKWIYRLNNMTTITKEIDLFFNQENPFIVNLGNTDDITNRFEITDTAKSGGGGTADILDYYNKVLAAYYQILGRQVNLDVKKERNVSNEIEASQENFNVVQSDWLNQFELFIWKVKELSGIEISIIKESQMEEKDDSARMDDNKQPKPNNE